MALWIDKPVICPATIGREGEIASLERALEQVHAGTGQTVLIAGEPGVGKSRVVVAARTRAEELGFLCLQGQCLEPDTALPFAPLIDLLRAQLTSLPSGALAANPGIAAPELSRLLPDLAMLLPGLAPPPAWREPEQEKRYLVQALSRSILAQASAQPLLLVVEDVHWSDETSLEFLLALARRLVNHPVLLVLTYRNEAVPPGLRHLLAELDRGRLAWELVLRPLTRAGVAAMLQAILGPGRGARAGFVDGLYTLTEGNPFFVEEVLKTLATTRAHHNEQDIEDSLSLADVRTPRSVEDAVLRRLGRLSPPARRVATLAAIAGPRFDFAALQAVAEHDEAELLHYIKELVAAQLVIEVSAERFAFRHALTRQAIYGQLLARERQTLHRIIYAAIEQQQGVSEETHLADLSYHAFNGGLWEKALTYARRMGERALSLGAPQEAIEQFARAFEAAQHLGQPPARELQRARGRAYEIHGEFERARQDYASALGAARQAGDQIAEWQSLLDLGFLWQARDFARAGDYLRQARDLAEHMGDARRLAQSLNRVGNWHANMGQPQQARELHQQALAIFRALDDRQGIAATLDLLAVTSFFSGNRRQAIRHFEEAATFLRELGDRQALASVLATLGNARAASRINETMPGPTPHAAQAVGECEEAHAIAREIGWRSGEAFTLCELAECLRACGEHGRALATAEEGLAIATEIEHAGWLTLTHSTLSGVYLDLLSPHAACWHAEQAYAQARAAGAGHLRLVSGAFLAAAHLLGQSPERAEEILRDLVPQATPLATLQHSVVLLAQGALSLAQGNPAQALQIAERVIEWGGQAGETGVTPRLAKLKGDALAALEQTDEAIAALEEARDAASEQGTRPLLWQIEATLGKLLRARGRREDADRAYAAARAVIEELAAAAPDDALREQFRASALARIPALRPPSPRRIERERHGGLTAREREVAALIARGLPNSQIAAALVISERTVEAHTGHIRDKLGLTSRAQVAAWAVEQGLLQRTAL